MYKLPIALLGLVTMPIVAAFALQEASGPVLTDPVEKLSQYGVAALVLIGFGFWLKDVWTFVKNKVWPDCQSFLSKLSNNTEAQTAAIVELTRQTQIQHQQMLDAILEHDHRTNGAK